MHTLEVLGQTGDLLGAAAAYPVLVEAVNRLTTALVELDRAETALQPT